MGAGERERRARHRRRALRARRRARRDGRHRRVRHPDPPLRRAVDPKLCLFEFVYFARPDTNLYGKSVHLRPPAHGRGARRARRRSTPTWSCPSPSRASRRPRASPGRSGIPYGDGLVKNRYIGRTFIAPTPETRAAGVRMKLNPLQENIAGKRLVVVDDSIVRGTTQLTLTRMLREAGADRGAPAGHVAAVPLALLLRHGHRPAVGAARRRPLGRRDPRLPRRRLARLPRHRPPRRRHPRAPARRSAPPASPASTPSPCPTPTPSWCSRPAGRAGRRDHLAGRDVSRPHVAGASRSPTPPPASTSAPARRPSSSSRTTSARRSGPRSWATSAGSAGCSPSRRTQLHDPLLVASTDGVGTKSLVARMTGRYDTIGIDCVAMWVDDIAAKAPSRSSSSTTSPSGSSSPR